MQVTVEPSVRIANGRSGIYVGVNDHYAANSADAKGGAQLLAFLENDFDSSIRRSDAIIDHIMSLAKKEGGAGFMMQANSSTAARNFNPLTDGDGISAGISQYASLATSIQVVDTDAAVDRVLASAKRKTEQGMPGGETGMRPDSLLDHTRSCSWAVPVVDFPPPPAPRPRTATFHALQEWEGHVARIDADEFVAQLVDLTAGHPHESEEVVIPMAEISEHDASRMAVGSIFRWVIGYERSPEGTRKRVSQIVFRDLPRMTANDLAHGAAWARKVASATAIPR